MNDHPAEERSFTPERLPKPLEEMSPAELAALFPVPKPPLPLIETERGLAVQLSDEAVEELGRIAARGAPSAGTDLDN